MRVFRPWILVVGGLALVATGCRAEDLLREDFDSLAPDLVAGQAGWMDNSKQGSVSVVEGESLSAPHHLELAEGGAVHQTIKSPVDPAKLTMKFAFKRKATEAGRNLQISLRGKEGRPVLFLNIRGSGKILDAGPNGEELTEYPFAEELPREAWLRGEVHWAESGATIRILSESGEKYLAETLPFSPSAPERVIVGSTPSTPQDQPWSVDDLLIQVTPERSCENAQARPN